MPKRLSRKIFDGILDLLLTTDYSLTSIQKDTGVAFPHILAMSDYIAIHGKHGIQELRERGCLFPRDNFDISYHANMIEFMYMTNLSARIVRVIFKCRFSFLDIAIKIRRDVGHPLIKGITTIRPMPSTANPSVVDDLVKKVNDGRSLKECMAKYSKELPACLENARYHIVQNQSDFRKYLEVDRQEQLNLFIECMDANLDRQTIRKRTGLREDEITDLRQFCFYHGTDELRRCNGAIEQRLYNKREYACIAEFQFAFNISSSHIHLIFKTQRGKVASEYRRRTEKQGPTVADAYIAKVPDGINIAHLLSHIAKRNNNASMDELTERYQKKYGKSEPIPIVGTTLTEESSKRRIRKKDVDAGIKGKLRDSVDFEHPSIVVGNSNYLRSPRLCLPPVGFGNSAPATRADPPRLRPLSTKNVERNRRDQEYVRKIMEAVGTKSPLENELKTMYGYAYSNSKEENVQKDGRPYTRSYKAMLPKPQLLAQHKNKLEYFTCISESEVVEKIKKATSQEAKIALRKELGINIYSTHSACIVVEDKIFTLLKSRHIAIRVSEYRVTLKELLANDAIIYPDINNSEAQSHTSQNCVGNDSAPQPDALSSSEQDNFTQDSLMDSAFSIANEHRTPVSLDERRSQADAMERSRVDTVVRSQVDAVERSQVDTVKRSQVDAVERSQVDTVKRSQVDTLKRSQVDAVERSQVDAVERSQVDAVERSQADAVERSQVDGVERSQADAVERSQADAVGRSRVDAVERSQADAVERSQVDAVERSQADAVERSQGDDGVSEAAIATLLECSANLNIKQDSNESVQLANIIFDSADVRITSYHDYVAKKREDKLKSLLGSQYLPSDDAMFLIKQLDDGLVSKSSLAIETCSSSNTLDLSKVILENTENYAITYDEYIKTEVTESSLDEHKEEDTALDHDWDLKFTNQFVAQVMKNYLSALGISAEEFIKNHKGTIGRKPHISIFSEGFDKLDPKLREKEIRFFFDIVRVAYYALKKKELLSDKIDACEYHGDREAIVAKLSNELCSEEPRRLQPAIRNALGTSKEKERYYLTRRKAVHKARSNRQLIIDFFVASYQDETNNACGQRKLACWLEVNGIGLCRKTIAASMQRTDRQYQKALQIMPYYKSRTTDNSYVVTDLIRKNFHMSVRFQVLFTDITVIRFGPSFEHTLYLAAYIDGYNGEILSYSISWTANMEFILAGLYELEKVIGDLSTVIIHTDRGFHYLNLLFIETLVKLGITTRSMSPLGDCDANGLIEGWHHIIKEEFIKRNIDLKTATMEDVILVIISAIWVYNNVRPSSKCDGYSPVVYANRYSPRKNKPYENVELGGSPEQNESMQELMQDIAQHTDNELMEQLNQIKVNKDQIYASQNGADRDELKLKERLRKDKDDEHFSFVTL